MNRVFNSFCLKFCLVNLNSLLNKVYFVEDLLKNNDINILAVNETWLTPNTPDSFVGIDGYSVERSDSEDSVRKHGVAFYMAGNIKYNVVEETPNNTLVIYLLEYDVYMLNIYRPPSNSDAQNSLLLEFLCEFCNDKEVLVMGDFNLPSIVWGNEPQAVRASRSEAAFLDAFTALGLSQVVEEPTNFPSCNTLDLLLLSHGERLGDYSVLPPLPACSHSPVMLDYVFQSEDSSPEEITEPSIRLWSRGKYDLISECLSLVDWESELYGLSTNDQYNRFCEILTPMIDHFIPEIEISSKRKPPWTINPPRRMRRAKAQAWQEHISARRTYGRRDDRTFEAWRAFAAVNEEVKSFALRSQIQYEKKLAQQVGPAPKLFHSYVRNKRVGRPSVGPLRMPDGELTDEPPRMAETFCGSFSSIFTSTIPPVQYPHSTCSSIMPDLYISEESIIEIIRNLDKNSTPGSDNIHPRLLKEVLPYISLPLKIIFNSSLSDGSLPDFWTESIVVPLFKKGSRYDPLNYRPVALTSVVCKIMERAIAAALWEYIRENNLLSDEQFGFRMEHSTVDQLINTYEDVTRAADCGKITDLIFFDFSKAFDRVSHQILLEKLSQLGISGNLLDWIRSFLVQRQMRVRVADHLSEPVRVKSGVPQGSVLGPILFLLYIDHVVGGLTCKFKIFADDIKIYLAYELTTGDSASELLQENIDRLVDTAASWNMDINSSKCAVLRFSPRNCPLPSTGSSPYSVGGMSLQFAQSHNDLGVVVHESLKFHEFIRSRVNVAGALTTNLLSSTVCRDADFLMSIYTSHVRPKLEYGSPLWNQGYAGDVRLVESVQRRWTRSVAGLEGLSYEERLRSLGLFSMQGRLLRADLIYLWKIVNGRCAVDMNSMFSLSLGHQTRGHTLKLQVNRARLDVRKRFFSQRVVPIWNGLSQRTVEASTLETFKSRLHGDLGQMLYDVI